MNSQVVAHKTVINHECCFITPTNQTDIIVMIMIVMELNVMVQTDTVSCRVECEQFTQLHNLHSYVFTI